MRLGSVPRAAFLADARAFGARALLLPVVRFREAVFFFAFFFVGMERKNTIPRSVELDSETRERREKFVERFAAMTELILLRRRKFRERFFQGGEVKDRVVPESTRASRSF